MGGKGNVCLLPRAQLRQTSHRSPHKPARFTSRMHAEERQSCHGEMGRGNKVHDGSCQIKTILQTRPRLHLTVSHTQDKVRYHGFTLRTGSIRYQGISLTQKIARTSKHGGSVKNHETPNYTESVSETIENTSQTMDSLRDFRCCL